jgi:hypothetical protein
LAFRDVSTLDESVRTAWPGPAPPRFVKAVATSPDDRRLIYVDGDNRVAVRDLADGHAIENLRGALALSSDGSMLATARVDGTVVLRDPGSGETIGLVPGMPRSPKIGIAFARDGARMVLAREGAGGNTGGLEVWSLAPADWVAAACAAANRDLTRFEWERYVGTTPPDNLRCLR